MTLAVPAHFKLKILKSCLNVLQNFLLIILKIFALLLQLFLNHPE